MAVMHACPQCGSDDGAVIAAAGTGRVHTWTTCHVAFEPELQDEVPYTVVVVELDEGARVPGRLVGDTEPAIGLAVVHTADLRFEAAS